MKALALFAGLLLGCSLVQPVLAQRGFMGGGFGRGGFVRGGFGHGGFVRGGFVQPGFRGFAGGGFIGFGRAPFFSPFVRPRFFSPFVHRGFFFSPFVHRRFGFFGTPGIWPWFGGYYGGGYYGGYADPYGAATPYAGAPNVTIVYPPPSEAGPPVREERRYEERPAPPRRDSIYFLIPLKDGTVHTGVAYWIEDRTLHFITTEGRHHEVPVSDIDRARAARLNEGRQIPFRLPQE